MIVLFVDIDGIVDRRPLLFKLSFYHDNNTPFYAPRNEVVGGYTGFTMSVRPSVDKSYVVR